MARPKVAVTSAALAGFALMRGRLRTVLIWGLAYWAVHLLALGLGMGVAAAFGYDWAAAFERLSRGETTSFSMLDIVSAPASLLSGTLIYAAIFRAKFQPDQERGFYLRIGADEWRLLLTSLAVLGLIFAAGFVVGMITNILTMLAALLSLAPNPIITVASAAVVIGACLWLGLRLSLALPMTFAMQRVEIGSSLDKTQGYAGRLLGMAVITVLLVVAAILAAAIAAGVVLAGTAAVYGLAAGPDGEGPTMVVTGAIIAFAAIMGIPLASFAVGAITVISIAPIAEVYLRLTGGPAGTPEAQAEIFS